MFHKGGQEVMVMGSTADTATLQKRRLGNSGLETAPVVLGGNVFGWTADEPTSFRILDAFVDAGFNMIDTADSYSKWVPDHHGGESEALIGRWFKQSGKRSSVLLATKVGSEMGPGQKGLSREYSLEQLDDLVAAASLRLAPDAIEQLNRASA